MKKLLLGLHLFDSAGFSQTVHSVTLTWTAGTGGGTVTSFQVQRGTVTGGPYTTIGSVPFVAGQTTYTYVDTASATNVLTEGTTYFYVKEAIGPGGTSAPSPEVSATIPFFAPAIPSKGTAVAQ